MNPVAEALTGWKMEETLGKNLTEVFNIVGEQTGKIIENSARKVIRDGVTVKLEDYILIARDGTEMPINDIMSPIRDDKGNIIGLVLVFHDISERKGTEDHLIKANRRYEELYQHGRECYAIIDDATGRFKQPNQAMLKVLGYSEKQLEGLRFLDILDEADREYVAHSYKARLEEKASKNYSIKYDCWVRTKAGEKRHMNIVESRPSFIHGTFLSAVDFTEQEKIKQLIVQSEKLSSLGQLAAGLAHELRNPLAVISSCSQFCLDYISLTQPVNENLQVIYRSSQRASELINNLLEFARPSHMEWGLVDINALVTRMWHMAELEATPFQISFVAQLKEGLPKIMGDADKLGQVFLNLFLNSIQAISSKGKILIKTHFLPSNNMVNIKVIDDGHGIPKDYRIKIFDPFFTTKDYGTGLGLSICHSIIQQHKGSITIDSDNEHGTTVSVRVPVVQDRKE
jgi:two-component system sporulation sensor kinase A